MTTLIVITDDDQYAAVEEALDSEVEAGEMVHFVRIPPVDCLGELLQDLSPCSTHDVDYEVNCLAGDDEAARVVEFAKDRDADRICLGISERTLSGKARINPMMQSVLMHSQISGDLVVGENLIVLGNLSYS